MWKCGNCGEELNDAFDTCWNCQTPRGAEAPAGDIPTQPVNPEVKTARGDLPTQTVNPQIETPRRRGTTGLGVQLEKRYRDAYRNARATIAFGAGVKVLAGVIGLIAVMVSLTVYQTVGVIAMFGALVGAFVACLIFVAGSVVSASGQHLLAAIDGVINTSPFLSNPERAAILRVSMEDEGAN